MPGDSHRQRRRPTGRWVTTAAYREIFGEHITGALLGFPVAMDWIDRRLSGEPAVSDCRR
jgi:hypothetical protein